MISFDEALDRIVAAAQQVRLGVERAPLASATGRVLAEAVCAIEASPPFDQSAMDGWAVRAVDTVRGEGGEVVLRVQRAPIVASVRRGAPEALAPGEAARIFTGGMMPPGADAVVRQERARLDAGGRLVLCDGEVRAGQDVRRRGEALEAGARLASAGEVVTPGRAAALAMAGVAEVVVWRPCRVRLLVTGDEVVPVGTPRPLAAMFDGNTPLLAAALGADPRVDLSIAYGPDDADALADLVAQARAQADVVLTTGGASVGDRDLIRDASARAGFIESFWKVAQRPGKPLYLAQHPDGTLHVGLPGTPAAVAVASALHLRWMLAALHRQPLPARQPVRWAEAPPVPDASRTRHVLASLDADGALRPLDALPGLLQLARAQAVAVVPPAGSAWWVRFCV